MTKEEIQEYLKRVDELRDRLTGEDAETLEWLVFGYNQCAKLLFELENTREEIREFLKGYNNNRDSFKWNEQDYIDVIEKIENILNKTNKE